MKNLWRTRGGTILSIAGILVLIVLIGGFAFSRGYFVRYVFNGEDLSRDQYFQMVETVRRTDTMMGCAPQWSLEAVYIYEIQCFDTEEAVMSYMKQRDGQP